MGERRSVCSSSIGISERNRPLEEGRHRWKSNIKMDLKEIGYGSVY
jgi:hypothetical protein